MSTVVAGIDGSVSARHAAAWAATEAAARGGTLRLVHAYIAPEQGYPTFLVRYPELREGLRKQGEDALREALADAGAAAPGVPVECELVSGGTVAALLAESRDARLIVLGSRGLGGVTGMLVGSVAVSLAAHGGAPLVVVRGTTVDDPPPAEGPIVVGTDGSDGSTAALRFAFETAAAYGAPVVAVHSWNDLLLDMALGGQPVPVTAQDVDAEERGFLDEQLAGLRAEHPDVAVEPVVARGRAAGVLLDFAAGRRGPDGRGRDAARLVVVGCRGRGGFRGMLLGSTSRSLITHAPCPVAVVRPGRAAHAEHSGDAGDTDAATP